MKPDIHADIMAVQALGAASPTDREEATARMEPLLVKEASPRRGQLNDLALELATKSVAFREKLPEGVRSALADLVRSMNCYYSNLIEGHDTHPVDIERALRNDYSREPRKRDLQHEATAHIEVQRWIDGGALKGRAATQRSICEIHRRFYELLPEELCWAEDSETHERVRVTSGELRAHDVRVGDHIAISPGAIPRFLVRFEHAYSCLGKMDALVGVAAAHHRLLWIHPFLDGNGRVARLMSHAMLRDALDTGGIWSVSRGFARNVASYKAHLTRCDMPRRNDLDGRGSLSEEELANFTEFFLATCIDQVSFMEGLVEPRRLRTRFLLWIHEEQALGHVPTKARDVLTAILDRGELPRAEVPGIVGAGDRHARRIVAALVEKGVVPSSGPRDPLRIAFPATLAARLMPGLFPEKPA